MIRILKTKKEHQVFLETLKARGDLDTGLYAEQTKTIVNRVRKVGDEALLDYTHQWDSKFVTKENMKIDRRVMQQAFESLAPTLQEAMVCSYHRIQVFHEKQSQKTWLDIKPNGEMLGQRITPLECVGVYVPGGKASYPSSVFMNAIPAKVAGVKRVVMVTPSTEDNKQAYGVSPAVLGAAFLAGVDELYTIGGAQAIAALAFGTETIPKVDKIVGPGNIYVALAKREVYGYVSIDSIAGPSEILIIADESANPKYLAADLLSQAEHDELASAVLVTPIESLALAVKEEVKRLTEELPRKDILQASLKEYSAILVSETLKEACTLANTIAPEHLELATQYPMAVLPQIKHAGAIFLGHYTPESVGDYIAGPNHVLPTNGTARFFSPLSVDDFIKKSSLISFSKEALMTVADHVITFAESESLDAHALAVKVRKEDV